MNTKIKYIILLLVAFNLTKAQTTIKLTQIEKAAGTGSTVVTNSVGALSYVPNPTLTISGQSLTISRGNTVTIPTQNYVTPEQYGAVGDGSTNDATAIQDAINSGSLVLFGAKNYRVNSAITLNGSKMAMGSGSLTVISTTSNISIFSITGANNTIQNITFKGNNTGTSQRGISAVGVATFTLYYISNIVSNCYFENLGGAGVYATNIIGTSNGNNHEGAFKVSNSIFKSCNYGIYFDTRAEYNSIIGCSASQCTVGVAIRGGNNDMIGGQITDCTSGLQILSGTNDAHGSIVGTKINHNTFNLSAGQGVEEIYSACEFYAGSISLTSAGVNIFNGCSFSMGSNSLTVTNSPARFNNCHFAVMSPNVTITGNEPIINSCYTGTNNATMIHVSRSYIETNTFAANGTFTVAPNASIESITIYNTTANAVTGGIKIGTTNGGTEVVASQAVNGNDILTISDASILKRIFSNSANTILYIQAVTGWNSASLRIQIKLRQNIL